MFWKKKKNKNQEVEKAKTKRFALLGEDIQYSLSPKIHSIIYRELGVDATYELFDVKKEDLEKNLPKLYKLDGFNVTKPYKQEIEKHIIKFGVDTNPCFCAVNTVCLDKMEAYNTDFDGFLEHMMELEEKRGFRFANETVLMLGAGGVAESVLSALLCLDVEEISIFNRTYDKAFDLVGNNRNVFAIKNKNRLSYNIVVNCTSYGLNEGENIAEGIDFSSTLLAYDTIYFDTEFLKTARKANVSLVVNGLDMLIYQAVASAEIFLGKEIKDKQALKKIILEELALESNSN
ncbi:MAG: hypothetical protein FWE13_02025 [Firmicutes bacterium]|nr:hypothetical protein [Bacillota bacterium]